MELSAKIRHVVVTGAIVAGIAAGGGTAQAEPEVYKFDPRTGATTIGEVVSILLPGVAERPGTAVGGRSERLLSGDELRVLVDGGNVRGATVANRMSSPALDTRLGTVSPDVAEPAGNAFMVFNWVIMGQFIQITCWSTTTTTTTTTTWPDGSTTTTTTVEKDATCQRTG